MLPESDNHNIHVCDVLNTLGRQFISLVHNVFYRIITEDVWIIFKIKF